MGTALFVKTIVPFYNKNITLHFNGRRRRRMQLSTLSTRGRFLPSKTVADPSFPSRVKAHINVPKFNKNTILATATPARTVNRQLPSCLVVSRLWVDSSSDIRPVCDVSLDNDVVLSAITRLVSLGEKWMQRKSKGTKIEMSIEGEVSHCLRQRCICMHVEMKRLGQHSLVGRHAIATWCSAAGSVPDDSNRQS
jgi:hypothetical protein